jgi:hypothetical protein
MNYKSYKHDKKEDGHYQESRQSRKYKRRIVWSYNTHLKKREAQ